MKSTDRHSLNWLLINYGFYLLIYGSLVEQKRLALFPYTAGKQPYAKESKHST